jgi:hypothetical protein
MKKPDQDYKANLALPVLDFRFCLWRVDVPASPREQSAVSSQHSAFSTQN